MKQRGKKVFKIILNIFMVLIILVASIVTIVSLSTKEKGIANIFGYIPLSIQSESMKSAINKGDLIITKKYNQGNVKKNDIIAFLSIEQEKTIIKTHRIIEIKEVNGNEVYVTKGDNNNQVDEQTVSKNDIVSVYTGKKISYAGTMLDFFKSQLGFMLCIILPLFALFIYQLYDFITVVIESKKNEVTK